MVTLVTGAAGFVGRALVERMLTLGDTVSALDYAATALPPHPRLTAIDGDLTDPTARAAALARGCDALIHLATVPGGAAEADPKLSRRVNVEAMDDLLHEARGAHGGGGRPRVIYASSIAVFGNPLPPAGVDDATLLAPRLVYGAHKAMMEIAVATMSRRGEIDGLTVRLPAILARPRGAAGMKSAFMSDLFHALAAGERYICPVSPTATIWAQSLDACVDNLVHAIALDAAKLPPSRAVTLPALRIAIADLVAAIARRTGADSALVDYAPDPALEAAFGCHPPLASAAADAAGFAHDGDVDSLVMRALTTLGVSS